MRITNIKCHTQLNDEHIAKVSEKIKSTSPSISKRTHSFVIIRLYSYVYTYFYSGFVNITGIKGYEYIDDAILKLQKFLDIHDDNFCNKKPVIDCMSANWNWSSSKLLNRHNLNKIIELSKEDSRIICVKYNRQRFPALFLKTNSGTVLWFCTPTVSAVGLKSKEDLSIISNIITQILLKYHELLR